ncbi:3-oxoacyl-[acyl-carrier protein] reductase [Rhizobium sp. NFR07]|uniref:SDR family NAD(P)-dependent oxidoreductase n=1 Tax=Rhizobium sp. NFR07 TaxID=1566262 RepID=UPI0008E1BDAF|nr:SDR family oxidoreductase [Rhizobium sp. NFR07]SFB54024.1 3-oxoacyl-[acyl-carrier protein] reductase [Rhizobium sp. NFR07]
MTEFYGRKAVVIGGSRGIGLATASLLATRGASLAVGARDLQALERTREMLKTSDNTIHVCPCDLSDAESVEHFVAQSAEALGGIDILINCASSFSLADSDEGWEAAIQIDLFGTVRAVRATVPYLRKGEAGAIVNVSSVSARQAKPDRLPYGAAKAAVEQYTHSAAKLYGPDRIRVNCVVPGSTFIAGGIWDRVRRDNLDLYNATIQSIPLGGLADPDSIAEGIAFLASTRARWITGQCLVVDGGQTSGAVAA